MTSGVPLALVRVPVGDVAGPTSGPVDTLRRQQLFGVVLLAVLCATPVIRGKLQLLDVVCLAALPLMATRIVRDRRLFLVCGTLVVWAVGQLISDDVNGLGLRLSLQLAAAVTMLGLVPALTRLARGSLQRMYLVQTGMALGSLSEWLIVEHVSPGSVAGWKYALDIPVAIGILAVTSLTWRSGRRWPSLLGLVAVAALGAATDSRHLAAVAAVTAVLIVIPRRPGRHPRTLSTLAGLAIVMGALTGLFLQSAGAGWIGERTSEQVAVYGTNPASFLVNVRPEMFQELYLYSRRPVFGWGSQPRMDSVTFAQSLGFLQDIGVRRTDLTQNWENLEVPGVAAHSTAVDSAVRGGLAAIPFWVLSIVLALRAGVLAINRRGSPLMVFWTMLIVWNMFFEPMTARYHLELAAYLALALTGIRTWTGSSAASPPDRAGTSR